RRDPSAGVRSRPAQARRRSNPSRRRPGQPRSTAASRKGRDMTASTADYYGILGLRSDATLTDVKKAYRKLARQHHPDRNNAHPGATAGSRRTTDAYEPLPAPRKANAHGPAPRSPAPAAPPRADVGMPGAYSEATSRVLTMLEETWQAIRARHPEIPPV